MRKTKRGGDGLTRARNGKGDRTESLASALEKMRKTKRGGDDLTRRTHDSRRAPYGREEIKELLDSVLEGMWRSERGGDDLPRRSNRTRTVRDGGERNGPLTSSLTRRSNRSRRVRGGGERNESLTSGNFYQDVWTGFSDEVKSNLSKSVASLALCKGNTMLFACSGIAIECQEHLTRFVTSASLVTALIDTKRDHDNLQIEVGHEGKTFQGFLDEYDLDHNLAVVIVRTFLDVNVALKNGVEMEMLPHVGVVLALGRDISGSLNTTNVTLAGDSGRSEDNEGLTCKITEVWEGGPLFTCDGKFIGMNLFLDMERAFFVSWGTILKWLECSSPQKKIGLPQSESLKGVRQNIYAGHFWLTINFNQTKKLALPNPLASIFFSDSEWHVNCRQRKRPARFGARPIGEKSDFNAEVEQFLGQLDSMGYPKPPEVLVDDMILVNTFEETFGDIYPKGVWRELSKKAASNIDRYVVALASFDGHKRSFACTGFLIEWNGFTAILTSASLVRSSSDQNSIDENLRIEVMLPSKRRIEGTLQFYSLHYNVALVTVKDCRLVRPANVQHCRFGWSKVAAVGRCFESGALMAMSGDLVSWSGTLDCPYIVRSTCKITKAGIGGPLVNLDGEVLGMNFYDTRIGTPFLLWSDIDNILAHFGEKSKAGVSFGAASWKMDEDHSNRLSRWPVPIPCWRHREDVDKDKSEDDLVVFDPQTGRKKRYGYVLGVKIELY